MAVVAPPPRSERRRVQVHGSVQGVGFRPFVHRLAEELGLSGSVRNLSSGVRIEVEGEPERILAFLSRISEEAPVGAHVDGVQVAALETLGTRAFEISSSAEEGAGGPLPLDAAVCADCLADVARPGDRRHRHPFASCAVCGPRYSILESMPWDRARTSMRGFRMCAACEAEYRDPWDRRFHAQTNCCPECGPRLELRDAHGRCLARDDAALVRAARAVSEGQILALQGLGGFQLVVDAGDGRAVARLRERKGRPDKPFAVLVLDLAQARALARIGPAEASALRSAQAPIVLLERASSPCDWIAPAVAPENPDLGVMLPATPLHHLLVEEIGVPVVATSGNRSGEPICHRPDEAAVRLEGLADLFLVHDRPIVHPIDDSVVRVFRGRPRVLRAARGFAPQSVAVPGARPRVVGFGGALKNAVAVSGRDVVQLGPHVGDLRSPRSRELARETAAWLAGLQDAGPSLEATDLHAGADEGSEEVLVQHHHAHALAAMAEHGVAGPVLAVAWDGNGHGPDGTIWGGEFLVCDRDGFRRVAHLRTFPLPGAERAIREGRRAALGILYELRGPRALHDLDFAPVRSFHASERRTIARMLERGLNCPRTSSMGRLFDAVASLVDVRQKSTFEGQAAMALEFAARRRSCESFYPFPLRDPGAGRPLVADWGPLVEAVLRDVRFAVTPGQVAACFHDAIAHLVLRVARRAGLPQVVLAGGCFQNHLLLARSVDRLRAAGFAPIFSERVPTGDGGLALGQVVHAATRPAEGEG